MSYLKEIFDNNHINIEQRNTYERLYLEVIDLLKEANVLFVDKAEMVFCNHMITLLERIRQDEVLNIEGLNYEEVSDLSLSLATQVIKRLSTSEISEFQSEIYLIATHIQINMEQKKEDLS